MKSSYCDSNACVEVHHSDLCADDGDRVEVKRSSFCDGPSTCVEFSYIGDDIYVGDSKEPGVRLRFTREEWDAFLKGAKAGEFDLPAPIVDATEVAETAGEGLTLGV